MQPGMFVGITPGSYTMHSVTVMLDKLQWPTLKDRRHHLIAAMMHNYSYNQVLNKIKIAVRISSQTAVIMTKYDEIMTH